MNGHYCDLYHLYCEPKYQLKELLPLGTLDDMHTHIRSNVIAPQCMYVRTSITQYGSTVYVGIAMGGPAL